MELISKKIDKLAGKATPPASKSQTIRALLLATLAKGDSVLHNVLISDDTNSAITACVNMGAKIERQEKNLLVSSLGANLLETTKKINSGNSGITTRFILPVLGLRKNCEEEIILDCGEQMKGRPLTSLIDALNNLGMKVGSINKNGTCPLKVNKNLGGGNAVVDGITSQYLSALLMSLPCAKNDSEIIVEDLCERPYMEMTLQWLDLLKINYDYARDGNLDRYTIKGRQTYHYFEKSIPGDFSSASYLIAAGCLLPGQIELNGLDMNDLQGDKELVNILQSMGADIRIDGLKMVITGGKELVGKTIDCNNIPDMVPTLAVIGAVATGKTELTNVKQARIKETDRLHSMSEGLAKMGVKIEEKEDGLVIHQSELVGTKVDGFEDHRTVMALALAGMIAKGQTIINTAESINKTFPNYIELMNNIGANMKIINK